MSTAAAAEMPEPILAAPTLAGFTIGVTADRRRDELAALLERRGARVIVAPTLRIVPLADDVELRAATLACLRSPPTVVMANTGIGMRGWLEAAEGWGLAESLRGVLGAAYLVARGPKARGAIRAAGLHDHWSPGSESCEEVVEHLVERGVAGAVVAMQLHGERQPECREALEAAGATVIEVPVYQWAPPQDPAAVRRLVDLITGRGVEAVTFTSAPAVQALLRCAGPAEEALIEALRSDVAAACVGTITAAALVARDVPVIVPQRARLGALVRAIEDVLPTRAPMLDIAGHRIVLRGHGAVIDGALRALPPAPMAVLRALAVTPGHVVSRAALLRVLPRGADEHAVEMAVTRLRAALGTTGVVQTVAKRGYRLGLD
jgi:uroporphyrinogen-III synthase